MDCILVVDDNNEITDLIETILVQQGYEVVKAYSGIEAVERFDKTFSLIILDVMMPEMDGYEVCRRIRITSNVPVLFLSAKGTDIDKVIGLTVGGDDYLVKPFSKVEMVARVKALIRRYQFVQPVSMESHVITVSQILVVDLSAHTVKKYGEIINLTKTEFDILALLARNKGRVFGTEEIFRLVWKENYYEGNNTVMVHLARLREKIEDDTKNPQIIKNVWGVGYKIDQ